MANKKNFFVNTEKGLNLRAEPTKEAKVLKVLQLGEKVVIDSEIEAPEDWVAVKDGGFVMKAFIR